MNFNFNCKASKETKIKHVEIFEVKKSHRTEWKEGRIDWLIDLEKAGTKLEQYSIQCEKDLDICCCPFPVINLFSQKREEDNYVYNYDYFLV